MWAGVRHHLEPRLVDDIKEVLGIDGESVSCGQHLLLVVLLETAAKETQRFCLAHVIFPTHDKNELLSELLWKMTLKNLIRGENNDVIV